MKVFTPFLIGAIVIGGVGANAYAMANNHAPAEQTIAASTPISKTKAIEIAQAESNGGMVKKVEEKIEDGKHQYEVEIVKQDTEVEVDIDKSTGKVLERSKEERDDDASDAVKDKIINGSAKISLEEAKKTALNRVKGDVVEGELDLENNQAVYEFEILTANHQEIEVTVDAVTGKIISVERED